MFTKNQVTPERLAKLTGFFVIEKSDLKKEVYYKSDIENLIDIFSGNMEHGLDLFAADRYNLLVDLSENYSSQFQHFDFLTASEAFERLMLPQDKQNDCDQIIEILLRKVLASV